MFESARDPSIAPWWSKESSIGSSLRRNSSFGRVNGNLSRPKVEPDDPKNELDLRLEGARKKLTWISREEHRPAVRNAVSNDRPSIENGSVHGRSARFGISDSPGRGFHNSPESPALQSGFGYGRSGRSGVPDSPGRGIHNAPESPARRGESMRRIRTPSIDFDMAEVPSSATPSRRLRSMNHLPRSASFKDGSAGAKSDHNVVREASATRRVSSSPAARDQRTAPKPKVHQLTTDDSASGPPTLDSPEKDRTVISYLAEETDRIIKGRIRKVNLMSHQSIAAADPPWTIDHERSSVGEAKISNGGGRPASNSIRQVDKTKAERVGTHDKHRDHRVGGREHQSDVHTSRPDIPTLPESQLPPSTIGEGNGPTRQISETMKNYLESRRKGANVGMQIIAPTRPSGPALSTASSHPNLAVLRLANQPENPSTSSKTGVDSRHDSFTAFRTALSPLNGNEDVTHSTTSPLSRSKEEHSEDPNRGRRKDSNVESVQVQGHNGFPSRFQYWAEFLGKGETDTSEGLRYLTQQTEERASSSGRKELETKIAPVWLHSNGARRRSSQERRQTDSSTLHPAARGHSGRYEEVERSVLYDKVLGAVPRGKHNSSRRSQSCRRDPVVNSLLDSSQETEAFPPESSKPVQLSGHDTSSDSKSSRRFSIDMRLSTSSDTIEEHSSFLAQIEKSKFLFRDSPERKISRRSSVVSDPESGKIPFSETGGLPIQGPSIFPTQTDKPKHRRPSSRGKVRAPHMESPPMNSQLSTGKKKNASNLERPKMSHKSSRSLDEDVYKKLFAQKEDSNRNGPTASTSTSLLHTCLTDSSKTPKPESLSTGASLQRWIANHFKVPGSKGRSSSTPKTREPQQEEQKSTRKKSPWRTRPAEIFQGITRKKVSSTRAAGAPLVDAHGVQNLCQGNFSESECQSPLNGPDPWHHRMGYLEGGSHSTPPHRNSYFLPSIATFSPTPSKDLQNRTSSRIANRAERAIAL